MFNFFEVVYISRSVSRKNIDAFRLSRKKEILFEDAWKSVGRFAYKTPNHFDFARISVRYQKTADIELVVRKEDSTSNERLSSLKFNLSLSLSLSRIW